MHFYSVHLKHNYSKMHHHIPHGGFGCKRHLQEKDKTSLMTHAFSKINMITLSNQRFLFTLEMMMKCLSTSFTRIKSHENLWSFFAYQRHCSIFSLKYSFYLSSKKRNQLFMENSIVMANNDNTWFSFLYYWVICLRLLTQILYTGNFENISCSSMKQLWL